MEPPFSFTLLMVFWLFFEYARKTQPGKNTKTKSLLSLASLIYILISLLLFLLIFALPFEIDISHYAGGKYR